MNNSSIFSIMIACVVGWDRSNEWVKKIEIKTINEI